MSSHCGQSWLGLHCLHGTWLSGGASREKLEWQQEGLAMVLSLVRYAAFIAFAVFLGYSSVHFVVYGLPPWADDSRVHVSLEIYGTRSQPVANAKVTLRSPDTRDLGFTDRFGRLQTELLLPQGEIATIAADGVAFHIEKKIMIPRLPRADLLIRMDPAAVALGEVTLYSRTLEELRNRKASLKAAPTSVPRRSSGGPHLMVSIQGEKPLPQHQFAAVRNLVGQYRQLYEQDALRRGARTLVLRPLRNAEDAYWETTLRAADGSVVSGFLFRARLAADKKADWMSRMLWLSKDQEVLFKGNMMTVKAAMPEKVRAYCNGIFLPRQLFRTKVQFQLPTRPGARSAISIVGEGPSWERRVVTQEQLASGLHLAMPEVSLSLKDGTSVRR